MESSISFACLYIVMPILLLALIAICIRIFKGPTLLDRVVAVDLFVTTSIAIIVAFSILFNDPIYVDVIIALSILLFLSTVGFAFYYQKRG